MCKRDIIAALLYLFYTNDRADAAIPEDRKKSLLEKIRTLLKKKRK